MTRGYFVYEKGGAVVKAAYIPSDAYIGGDTCREILMAFYEGREMELLDKMGQETAKQDIEHICPEWYRITAKSQPDDYIGEYGYVLKGETLTVYYWGKKLFSIKREHASTWAKVSDNIRRFELTYLYSDEKLDYNWNLLPGMYRDLSKKIDGGTTYEELASTLRSEDPDSVFALTDSHMISATHTPQFPSYVKVLRCGNDGEVRFYAERFGNRYWTLSVQCPYIRIPIRDYLSSERACVNYLRTLIRKKRDAMAAYAEVCGYISKIMDVIRDDNPEAEDKIRLLRRDLEKKEKLTRGSCMTLSLTLIRL